METINMEDDREEETALAPPGFRFFPTEEELVSFYLPNKLLGTNLDLLIHRIIPVLDIYHFNPWDLPKNAGVDCRNEQEQWFFFVPRQESEARGGKPNRLTTSGYWKATGSPGNVYSSCNSVRAIGVKRTMVFYEGRAPEGTKTEWKMNEYKAFAALDPKQIRQEFSLCRVYKKSKCLRTFDRRPSAPSQVMTRDDHDDMQGTTQLAQYHIGVSPSSSSIINVPTINSVDDQPAADEETNILDMDVDYNNQEALLDWDCLQWD